MLEKLLAAQCHLDGTVDLDLSPTGVDGKRQKERLSLACELLYMGKEAVDLLELLVPTQDPVDIFGLVVPHLVVVRVRREKRQAVLVKAGIEPILETHTEILLLLLVPRGELIGELSHDLPIVDPVAEPVRLVRKISSDAFE